MYWHTQCTPRYNEGFQCMSSSLFSESYLFFKILCSEAGEEAPRPSGRDCLAVKCCPHRCVVQDVTPWGHDDYRCTVCPAVGGHHLCLSAAWALPTWWESSRLPYWWVSSHANYLYNFCADGGVCKLLEMTFCLLDLKLEGKPEKYLLFFVEIIFGKVTVTVTTCWGGYLYVQIRNTKDVIVWWECV